ncbi:MAG: hypothetical protein VX278_05200 [Myxococcota bacterium]|nr:hypothetical protein [Myxococcota bacterium]
MIIFLFTLTSCTEKIDKSFKTDTAEITEDTPNPNRDRFVVYSLPYDENLQQASTWGTMLLTQDRVLSDTGTRFQMGRSPTGSIRFHRSGNFGYVAQDDGSVGAFEIDADGVVSVIYEAFSSAAYAEAVYTVDDTLYIIDPNWPGNGGGIYRADIDPHDGTLSEPSLWISTKLAKEITPFDNGFLLLAMDCENSAEGQEVHYIGEDGYAYSVDAFADTDSFLSSISLNRSQNTLFVADNSEFGPQDNRVGILSVSEESITADSVLSPLLDPIDIIASPLSDDVAVISGYGNAVYLLDDDYRSFTELSYIGAAPQLPGQAGMITTGDLQGTIVLAENQGVRLLAFESDGLVDYGLTSLGSGSTSIVGAIGIQP